MQQRSKPAGALPPRPLAQQTAQAQREDGGDQQATPEPAEAAAIKDLLSSLGIKKYDPRVVPLLMDFTWRTTSDMLRDAEAINLAAGGTGADLTPQDIALASAQQTRTHATPPPLHELHALARLVNAQPLTGPSDKQHGIKLPPVADCLLGANYQVKQRPRPAAPQPTVPALLQPQRQHLAVRKHNKLGMALPQQGWQPPADAAGADAQPFAPPAHGGGGGGAAGAAEQQQQQGASGMDVDQEEI